MPRSYNEKTQEILKDFLQVLSTYDAIDPDFLAALHQMTNDGKLGNHTRIRQSIALLEAKANELQDKHHRGPQL